MDETGYDEWGYPERLDHESWRDYADRWFDFWLKQSKEQREAIE